MTDQHPIIPHQELIEEWTAKINSLNLKEQLIVVAQWGADQELEDCCSEINFIGTRVTADSLRSRRRPKPPSLRKQALDVLKHKRVTIAFNSEEHDIIRAALEALPND